ncbi:hypothetical protein F2Q69_00023753 [Brassica cretica]|uniref:Replication factor A C-terminal domain-containing protein n=1 Tax=Brassica cretica TaxID=69181 RepID=A0A8S9QQG8_BRACR|nr:hypothetical protein F2Q69_00023753 [Brassica cretica]
MKLISSVLLGLLGSSNKMAGLLSHAPDATGSWSNLEPSLRCNKCVTPPHHRCYQVFCVELAVDDGKDSDTFVIFDKEMTRLTKQEVVVLAFEEIPTGGEEELPSCLVELSWEGRAINNLLPLSEEEGGITTTSSNETVVAAKLGMGGETANPPGNKNVVNTHKHHRE